MAKVALQKIRITGYKKHYKILMQELHRAGIVEITEDAKLLQNSETEVDEHFGVFDLARLDFAINFLSEYGSKKSKVESILTGGKLVISEEEAKNRLQEFSQKSEKIISECELCEEELVKSKNELAKIPERHALLAKLGTFNLSLAENYSTEQTKTWVGSIPAIEEQQFVGEVSKESNLLDLQILSRDEKRTYIRLTVFENLAEKTTKLLEDSQFEDLDTSELIEFLGKTPAEINADLEKTEIRLKSRIEVLEKKATELSVHTDEFRILYDYNHWRKVKNDLQSRVFRSPHLFAFEGWMPTAEYEKLEKWLKNAFVGEAVIEKIEPKEGEEMPVLLKNAQGFSSFEPITGMFGLPKTKEFDPTIFMAPFFMVFFGLCLSDVGYGAILLLVASWLLLFGKFSKEAKNAIFLLLFCGISAILGGIILGGYFGLTTEQAPAFLVNSEGKFVGQLLDPMAGAGPVLFLGIALGLGLLQLFFGIILDFVKKIMSKDYIDAVCDPAAWFFFLLMLVLYGAADYIGLEKDLMSKLYIAGAGILVLTQGRDQKNWLLKPIFGILGLYNITAYLSDLLSYSRIMALGLATGVVGFAMNITAGILNDMIAVPVLGTLVAIFVILFGHTLNFCLSILGAFIHSGRLQFIEFFGKFYEGGGREFQPFKRKKKYLHFE